MGWIPSSGAFVAFFFLHVVFRTGLCCDGWSTYGEQCFMFYDTPLRAKHSADLKCILEGSNLVSISDNDTLSYLKRTAHDGPYWVGADRNRNSGEVEWANGEKVDQPWVDVGDAQDRLMCFSFNGTFVTRARCISKMKFICSRPAVNTTGPRACHWELDQKESFVGEFTGHCLFRIPTETTWSQVEEECGKHGGSFLDLQGVMADSLNTFHDHKLLTNDGHQYWTGLMHNGSNMYWSSGRPLDSHDYSIPFVQGSGSCVTVQFNFTDVLETHLFQTECNETARVLCFKSSEAATTTTTPTGGPHGEAGPILKCPDRTLDNFPGSWKAFGDNCYWETSYETNLMTWYDAENFCKAFEGGHLASFHSLDEEKVGLSFQHGKFAHKYWIGLHLDIETETYKWSDGTPLNYTNWAQGHPNHLDKSLRCVQMDAKYTHWISSLCGVHSWFVCRVRKRSSWPTPVIPTPTPLQKCDHTGGKDLYYFDGSCYFPLSDSASWHRGKEHCENEGASLVSIHSNAEVEFLLRLLNVVEHDSRVDHRLWIGLNRLGADDAFHWTDWTPVDYVYWNDTSGLSDDRSRYQQRCANMNARFGVWFTENCNAPMGFICKRSNDPSATVVPPTTPDPKVGNCKKGWITHDDRCYLLGGVREKDRANWTQALDLCTDQGGYLTSVRDEKDQAFLAYLLQSLRMDAWIGLHIMQRGQAERYYWVDNSEMRFDYWAPGAPSHFTSDDENCVSMVFDAPRSGIWKDVACDQKLAYICQARKDPNLPTPSFDRGLDCLNHEGWLKLNTTCFKMFGGNYLNWSEAEAACQQEGAHLVSVTDRSVRSVVSYLATGVNDSFWIGLRYKESDGELHWLNGWPMSSSYWEKNEPSNLNEEACFASTMEGYWKKVPCEEVLAFMCQFTTGRPPQRKLYTGSCSSKTSTPGPGSFCYSADNQTRYDFYDASFKCMKQGSQLASIHSKEELDWLKTMMKPEVKSFFIGLTKSVKGGFAWSDDSPVEFVNWDEDEPDVTKAGECVEVMADTLKWRIVPCTAKRHFVCKESKDTLYYEDYTSEKLVAGSKVGLSSSAVTAIVIFSTIAIMLIVVAALYHFKNVRNRPQSSFRGESGVSFENALYHVNSASMEFHDEQNS